MFEIIPKLFLLLIACLVVKLQIKEEKGSSIM